MTQTLIIIFLKLIIITSIISSQINGFTMKMIPIESEELQLVPNNLTPKQRRLFLYNISLYRAHTSPITKNTSNLNPNAFGLSTTSIKRGYYVTQFEVGNGGGAFKGFFLIDTGSANTWVQCKGCNPCFPLRNKYFKYMNSGTFERMGVNHRLCDPKEEFAGSCRFEMNYGTAHIEGFLGFDNFYFKNAITGETDRYPEVAFGCGLVSQNFIFGDLFGMKNPVAGVHGLAPGPLSFLSQLSHETRGRFSYCLVPMTIKQGTSNLQFGDDAQISGDDTRMVQAISMEPNALLYHLFVNGISVDGNRLPIDPSVFELNKEDYSKGFLIDSGAPNTVLVGSAYDPLRDAITGYFRYHFHMVPKDHGTSNDLCYDIPPFEITYPTVTFHFMLKEHGEVDMVLGKENVFEMYKEGFCMTIFPTDHSELSLLGAFQQANFKFLYDINDWLLYFVPQICTAG